MPLSHSCTRGPSSAVLVFLTTLGASAPVALAAYDPDVGFSLGYIGPSTSWDQEFVAAAVAFDLDFRKYSDPALEARFGPPVINISNPHPNLNVTLQIGTSHSQPETGLRTALNWFQGVGKSLQVVGIVGGAFSSISMPIASNGAVFGIPQVSWGSTSPELSDKQRFPYFLRVIPPDDVLGDAMWAWKVHFEVPSMVALFSRESFGTGLYEALRDAADRAGELELLSGVGVTYMQEGSFSVDVAKEALARLRRVGKRFVILISTTFTAMYHVLELEGMLYSGRYQLIGTDASLSGRYVPSKGLPIGFVGMQPVTRGPLFDAYVTHFVKMNTNDIYSHEAMDRYNMHAMQAPFVDDPSIAVTNDTFVAERFADGRVHWLIPFIFDSCYSFVLAINELLHEGEPPDNIKGKVLLDKLRSLQFEGITGEVSFNEKGDRSADYDLLNSITGGDNVERIGVINPNKAIVRLFDSNEIMWATGNYSAMAPDSLSACDPGMEWTPHLGVCTPCSSGFTSPGGSGVECMACAPGSTTSGTGATTCAKCDPGWFNDRPGENCSMCKEGTFSKDPGASTCEECEVGSFADHSGASVCQSCGEGLVSKPKFTTWRLTKLDNRTAFIIVSGASSREMCGCDVHTRNQSGECVDCSEGLVCNGMGDVRVQRGYYAQTDLSVFRCHTDKARCPGGLPGATCALGRQDLTCAECKDRMRPTSGGGCVRCQQSDHAPFVLAVMLIFFVLVLVYHFIDTHNRATQSHAVLLCSFALAQLITVSQQMSIIGMIHLDWKEPLVSFFKTIGLLTFDLELLRLGCVGDVKPFSRYVVKVFAVFMGVFVVVIVHCLFVVVRYKGRFVERTPVLVGTIGTIFMVLYISVTSAVLEPLQCLEHPNGLWTVRAYPTIECWESGQHKGMLALGSVILVLVPIGFLVMAAKVVRDFPKRMRQGDSRWVRAFSFLFVRFRPRCHTYVLVHLLRSFLMAAVLVLPQIMLQVLAVNTILLVGLANTLLWLPWRVDHANALDAVFSSGTLLLVTAAVAFVPEEDRDLESVAEVSLAVILAFLTLVPAAVVYGVWRRFLRKVKPFQFFLCHHKVGSGAWTRLLKLHLMDSGKIKTGVFIDSDNLDNLDHLFSYVGHDTGTLLVVGTQDIFKRPWCLGEMCAARLKSVTTVLLCFPDFEHPQDHAIANLHLQMHDLEVLIESGMTIPMLQETLRWVKTLSQIVVSAVVTVQMMDVTVNKILCNHFHNAAVVEEPKRRSTHDSDAHNVLLCDRDDMENVATGYILRRMLTLRFAHEYEKVPRVTPDVDGHMYADGVSTGIVICSNLAFARMNFLRHLMVIGDKVRLIPVIADSAFQIPGKGFSDQLFDILMSETEVNDILGIVASLFRKIGISFQPGHASEKVLEVCCAEIAKHIGGQTTQAGSSSSVVKSFSRMSSPQSATPRHMRYSRRSGCSVEEDKRNSVEMNPSPLSGLGSYIIVGYPTQHQDGTLIVDM